MFLQSYIGLPLGNSGTGSAATTPKTSAGGPSFEMNSITPQSMSNMMSQNSNGASKAEVASPDNSSSNLGTTPNRPGNYFCK